MAGSREQAAAMELASYSSKEKPVIDDQELGSEGADLARIERVYKYVGYHNHQLHQQRLTKQQKD
jgi:hypothetical protein